MRPPPYKPLKSSTPASTNRAAIVPPVPHSANTSRSSDPADNVRDTFYEIYRAPSAGLGWRWSLWKTTDDGRALLVSMSERNMATREEVVANIEEFKKIATQSTIRTA